MGATNYKPALLTQIADFLGINRDTVKKRLDRAGIKPIEQGTKKMYYLPDVLPYFLNDIFGNQQQNLEARERKLLADAILAEMQVAEKQKQLVTLDAIDAEHERFVMEIKSALLNLPKKISPMLLGLETVPEISAILEHEMDEALRNLARMGE